MFIGEPAVAIRSSGRATGKRETDQWENGVYVPRLYASRAPAFVVLRASPSFLKKKLIEGIDHERGARQGGNECADRAEMEAGAESDKQKHKQAED